MPLITNFICTYQSNTRVHDISNLYRRAGLTLLFFLVNYSAWRSGSKLKCLRKWRNSGLKSNKIAFISFEAMEHGCRPNIWKNRLFSFHGKIKLSYITDPGIYGICLTWSIFLCKVYNNFQSHIILSTLSLIPFLVHDFLLHGPKKRRYMRYGLYEKLIFFDFNKLPYFERYFE